MKTADKPLLRALRGAPVTRHPFWLMRQAGRYLPEYRELRARAGSFLELCLDADRATEITLQPIRRYGMDGAIVFSDILLVPMALGQAVAFREGEGPKLPPIHDRAGLTRLAASADLGRIEKVYETICRVRAMLPAGVALIGFAGAPWTVATYMVEGGSSRHFAETRGWAERDEAGFAMLIDRIAGATIAHLEAQLEAGAELLQLFDSWAGALEGEAFARWVIAPTRRIVTAIKARWPAVPIIGFPKGAGGRYPDYVRETGVDAVSVDADLPLETARDALQPLAAVQGNLDPALLVAGGAALEARARQIVALLGKGRFVFNLGHGVLQTTPPEHVAMLADLLRSLPVESGAAA